MGEPVEVVVDRVVLRPFIFSAEANVQGRNSCEILKCGEVGTVAQRIHAEIAAFASLSTLFTLFRLHDAAKVGALKNGNVLLRIFHIVSDRADDRLQILGSSGVEISAPVAVGV